MQPLHLDQQQLAEQRDRIEGYLRDDPKNPQLLIRAVELNLALSDTAGAQLHAKAALALLPDDPMIRCLNAHVLTAQRKWDEAGHIYAALLKTIPDPDLAFSLASCQVWQGQHQSALDTMAPFAMLVDMPAPRVTLLVRALCHVGKLEEAKELVGRHHARLVADPVFLAAASLAYMDSGELEQATVFSDAALALGERPIEALVVSGSLALVQGQKERALELYQEALALNPNEGRAWAGMGEGNLLARDFGTARRQLETAARLLPTHIGTLHSLGWCHFLSDNMTGAAEVFSQALKLDRNFAETHGALAAVEARTGKRAAAEAGIERAFRLDATCMSARLAQLILGGVASNPERFYALAMRAVGRRKNAFGVEMKELIDRQLGRD